MLIFVIFGDAMDFCRRPGTTPGDGSERQPSEANAI